MMVEWTDRRDYFIILFNDMKVTWLIYCSPISYESNMSILPNVGDSVDLYNETYKVKEKIFDGICDEVKIIIEEVL